MTQVSDSAIRIKSSSRRQVLKAGLAVTAGLGLAGCSREDLEESQAELNESIESMEGTAGTAMGPPSLDPSAYADYFDRVVVATDVGADPTGEQPIDSILNAELQPGTLLHFPEGIYKMNSGFRATGRRGNLGITGHRAVIRHGEVEAIHRHTVDRGEYSGTTMMFRIGTSSRPHHGNFVFGGLIFDWAWHEDAGMQGLNAFIDGQAEIRNIVFHGTHSLGSFANLRVASAEPDSVALVDSIDMRGGGLHYIDTINTREERRFDDGPEHPDFGQSWGSTGFTGHPDQQGTTVIRNMVCGPWPDNTVYPRGGTGRKIVSGCTVWNGGGSQIRNNGGDDWEPVEWVDGTDDKEEALDGPYPGSVVENCYVLIDHKPEGVYIAPRGILLQDGPQLVRNCEIEIAFSEAGGAGGTYGIGTRGEGGSAPAGPAVVEECVITLREDANAVYVSPYTDSIDFREMQVNVVGWNPVSSSALMGGETPRMDQLTINTVSNNE